LFCAKKSKNKKPSNDGAANILSTIARQKTCRACCASAESDAGSGGVRLEQVGATLDIVFVEGWMGEEGGSVARELTLSLYLSLSLSLSQSCQVCNVPPGGKALIPTGISIEIPSGHYARIAPRSSLAWKSHIDVGAGVVDIDYRGEVKVVLFNHAKEPFEGTSVCVCVCVFLFAQFW
jgi:hypothetical protein